MRGPRLRLLHSGKLYFETACDRSLTLNIRNNREAAEFSQASQARRTRVPPRNHKSPNFSTQFQDDSASGAAQVSAILGLQTLISHSNPTTPRKRQRSLTLGCFEDAHPRSRPLLQSNMRRTPRRGKAECVSTTTHSQLSLFHIKLFSRVRKRGLYRARRDRNAALKPFI